MMKNIHSQRILIIDFGSQYTQLIARRVRELGVYCEIRPFDLSDSEIESFAPKGIILSGGPESVTETITPRVSDKVFSLGCPVLGICYGMQAMAVQLAGEVESSNHREFGYAQLEVHGHSELLANIEDATDQNGKALLDVWMSHGDRVTHLPPGFAMIASSSNAPIAAMADEERHFYGLQFHPEVSHTKQGQRVLEKFVRSICQCDGLWTAGNIVAEMIEQVHQKVAGDEVLLGLSGGVDSSVVAALLHQAIGDRLVCVFVDNGLLRQGEVEQVKTTFTKHLGIRLVMVDAQQQFMQELAGVADPERKRKIAGKVFVDVFQQEAVKFPNVKWLAQGTIYPDVVESAASKYKKGHVIKSHHNVGGLPETLHLQLLEPLRELFKDEVRRIGLELGLPHDMVYRHPFPGPGLAVRILGEIKKEYADILRQADYIFIEELHKADLYHEVAQAFCVFLPIKSVGVMGDARKYEHVVALRAVETTDFMTAHWAHLPYAFIEKVSNRIINEVSGISRVVYDVSSKPPATIEWE